MTTLEVVRDIYDAFGHGDIPSILRHMADDVEWEYGLRPNGVPWLQPRRGREKVIGFFEAMAGFDLHRFHPKTLLAHESVVVVLIDVELTVKATGTRIVEEDEVHIWYFDANGRVTRFGHKVDTHQHWLACGSPSAPFAH